MRNHNGDTSIPQEFYLWDTVAESARKSLDIRYRLLDYIYTALHKQTVDGTPLLSPVFFQYPNDANTFAIDLQFFCGDSILVSPVTEENATSVTAYVPNARFYDFYTYATVEGAGANITLNDVAFTQIPLHIKGGSIIPMRNASGYTTTEVRKQPFSLIVAPDRNGNASGGLYLDDGDSIEQAATSEIEFSYSNGVLEITGSFGYQDDSTHVVSITVLDSSATGTPSYRKGHQSHAGRGGWKQCSDYQHDISSGVTTMAVEVALDGVLTVRL